MPGLLDMFGGGDIYGDLLSPAQKQAMAQRGLLAMAGAFGQAAMPSRMPVPLGAAMGQAASAYGESQDAAGMNALRAMLVGQQGQKLKSELEMREKLKGILPMLLGGDSGVGGAAPAATPAGLQGPLAAPDALLPPTSPVAAPDMGGGLSAGGAVQGSALLQSMLQKAGGMALPAGYQAVVTSQDRPGARVAGTGGVSQHALGNAIDVQILDPKGNPIANEGEDTTGLYGKLAVAMRQVAPPEVASKLGWGGNFTTGPANGPRDLMHFDLAGDRGRYGTLAQMVQQAQYGGGGAAPAQASDAALLASVPTSAAGGSAFGSIARPPMQMAGGQPPTLPPGGVSLSPEQFKRFNEIVNKQSYAAGISYLHSLLPAAASQLAQAGPLAATPAAMPVGGPLAAPPAAVPAGGPLAAPGVGAAPMASPAPAASGGYAAGLNPRALAAAGVLSQLGGMPDVFKPLETLVYNSPEYKAAVAEKEAAAKLRGELPYVGPTATAKTGAERAITEPSDIRIKEAQAALDRVTKTLEQRGAASLDMTTIAVGGKEIPATREQARRAALGLGVPELNIAPLQPSGAPAAAGATGQMEPGGALGKPIYSPQETELGKGLAEDFNKRRAVALDAAKTLEGSTEARKLLNSGIYSGILGPAQLEAAKVAGVVIGGTHRETVANTEAFLAQRAREVATVIKSFGAGTGLSDADREYAAKIVGGQQRLDEASIRKILDIGDKASLSVLDKFNRDASKVNPRVSPGFPLTVDVPAAAPQMAVNPQTGQRLILRDNQWVPQ